MTLESDPVGENDQTPNTGGKSNNQATQSKTDIPRASTVLALPPAKTDCQITCKAEKDWWDKFKFGAEILGIILLAVYTAFTIKMYCANKAAADAAKSAADTAKNALHISERAYITDGAANIDATKKAINLPILNGGHIPSGPVEVIIHETTVTTSVPTTTVDLKGAGERHWGRYNFQSIPLGWPLAITIPAPQISASFLTSGRQMVIVAGFITYNDGFPDTPQQQWFFCQKTTYQTTMKQLLIGPCNPNENTLRIMESLDGYPNNPEP
jgi:hypothetical protein